MLRGLEGRRIAAAFPVEDGSFERRAGMVNKALEEAGARVHVLRAGEGSDEDWHGGRYAALIMIGDGTSAFKADPRLVQLVREFLASDKPVAAMGTALSVIVEAGGAAGRTMAADGPMERALRSSGAKSVGDDIHVDGTLITAVGSADAAAFAKRVVAELSSQLEEREVDEMSEMSFPASDPPATTPSSIGRVARDRDGEARS